MKLKTTTQLIFIPLILISSNAYAEREIHQKEINAKYIRKAKVQLSKEDLLKLEKEINKTPKESTSDYLNIPKDKPIELIKALGSSYQIEKTGILYNKKAKKKTPIKLKLSSTGISNEIYENNREEPIYRVIKKVQITMTYTDDKVIERRQITLDKKMNILSTIEETKINGKLISSITCKLISKRNDTPEKIVPIYNSNPYQLKCDDGSIITSKYDLDFGDKEFEGSLNYYSRLRGKGHLSTQKINLKINSEGDIYNATYYQDTNDAIVVVK